MSVHDVASSHEQARVGGPGEIDLAPFQERFRALERGGLTLSEVARRLGWYREYVPPDVTRVKRALGLAEANNGHGYRGTRTTITAETARRLCEALDMDPHEAGL